MSLTTVLMPAECVIPECNEPPDYGTVDRRSEPWSVWFLCRGCFVHAVAEVCKNLKQLLEGGADDVPGDSA